MNYANEPLSAYALWKLEDDEKFYRTFPAARYAAHRYDTYSGLYYFDYSGCYGSVDDIYTDAASNVTTSLQSRVLAAPLNGIAHPPALHYDYLVPEQVVVPTTPHFSASTSPVHRDCATRRGHHDTRSPGQSMVGSSGAAAEPSHSYTQPVEIVQSHIIVPSQQPRPTLQQVMIPTRQPEHIMDFLPSPLSAESCSSSNVPSTPQDQDLRYDPASGCWVHQADGLASQDSQELTSDPRIKSESPLPPSPHKPHGPHRHLRFSRSLAHSHLLPSKPCVRPGDWTASRPPSPRNIRLSPFPMTRRPAPKKPPLACLFCRGRKIACGPPEAGSTDRSCNQCQRRSIKCEYPLESRRGMRKKKQPAHLNPAGPKIKLGRKSSKGGQ